MSSPRSVPTRAPSRSDYQVKVIVQRRRIAKQARFSSRRKDSLAKRQAQGQLTRVRRRKQVIFISHSSESLLHSTIAHPELIQGLISGKGIKKTAASRANMLAALPNTSDLKDALRDLEEVPDAAREQEIQEPSETAFATARRLIQEMYSISPRCFIVYPMPHGYIAIDGRSGNDRAVMMVCGSDGDAQCIVTIDGEDRRAHYSTTSRLPDDFVRQALNELETGLVP